MYSLHSIRQPLPVASWASFSSITFSESSTAIFPMRIYRKRLGTPSFRRYFSPPPTSQTAGQLLAPKERNKHEGLPKTHVLDTCHGVRFSGRINRFRAKRQSRENVRNLRHCDWKRHGFFDGARLTRTLRFHEEHSSCIPTNFEPSTSDVWKAGREFGFNRNLLIMTTSSFFFFFLTFRNDFYLYCEPATGTDLSLINVEAKKSRRLTSEG